MKKQFLIVTVPIANLRKEPVEASFEYVCDDLQETQLLFNERLLYKDEKEDWCYVEAVEQQKVASQGDWQGYPGWIQKTSAMFIDAWPVYNAVVKRKQAIILKDPSEKAESLLTISMGTKLAIEDEGNEDYYTTTLIDGQLGWIKKDDLNIPVAIMNTGSLRKNIIETTKLLLGMPYLWGGRSAFGAESTEHRAESRETRSHVACRMSQGSAYNMRRDEERGTTRHPSATTPKDRSTGGVAMEAEALASNLQPLTLNLEPRTVVTGVDCSSLTNLAYRVNWLDIPRDAHDQWRASTQIGYETLEPADLIFVSAEEAHDKITHVMMYLTGEEFIEALETGSVVTINTFKNKFGVTFHETARQDFVVNKRKIYFGAILTTGEIK